MYLPVILTIFWILQCISLICETFQVTNYCCLFLQAADEDERVLEKISFFQDMLISYRVGTLNRGEINMCTMYTHLVAYN